MRQRLVLWLLFKKIYTQNFPATCMYYFAIHAARVCVYEWRGRGGGGGGGGGGWCGDDIKLRNSS